jgi:hypothetical protein
VATGIIASYVTSREILTLLDQDDPPCVVCCGLEGCTRWPS